MLKQEVVVEKVVLRVILRQNKNVQKMEKKKKIDQKCTSYTQIGSLNHFKMEHTM